MKLLICIFSFSFLHISVSGQAPVLSFSEAETQGISIIEIDNKYKSAIHAQPDKAVFTENQKKFIREYKTFITELAKELNNNGFYWDEPARVFTRIYFSRSGEVDYFFYNNEHAKFEQNDRESFEAIVRTFIAKKSLRMESTEPFSQCSPVVYANVLKVE